MQTYDSFNALAAANAAPLVSGMSVFNSAQTINSTQTANASDDSLRGVDVESRVRIQEAVEAITKVKGNAVEPLMRLFDSKHAKSSGKKACRLLDDSIACLQEMIALQMRHHTVKGINAS